MQKNKLAILSNVNIDPLQHTLSRNQMLEIYCGGYNQWQTELLNTTSGLHLFTPDLVFIYLNTEEYKGDIQELFTSIDFFSQNNNTTFIISNFTLPPYTVSTYIISDFTTKSMNDKLYDFAVSKKNIIILDLDRLIRLYGYRNLFNDKFWYLGKIKFSNLGFTLLGEELNYLVNVVYGKTKKVLILDLDNTLWGGLAGEDGPGNVELSSEGKGRIFLDFQKHIKQLQQTGVLLAICSKNNENDVKEIFNKNSFMLLMWDDFINHKVNWNPKADNIIEIAQSLQLGLDSFVFIDDNPAERESVRLHLPDVTVPEFPSDISILNYWFINDVVYPYFGRLKLTMEDSVKTEQYKRNAQRNEIKKELNYDEFIKQLNIKLNIFRPKSQHHSRIAQLTQKTNQFNLTSKKYTENEIKSFLENPLYKIVACEYEDKFGKEGIIGTALIKIEQNKAIIDTFLLSCRVLGRKVEYTFLNGIIDELKQNSIDIIEGIYIETPKNKPAKEFYTKAGFRRSGENIFTLKIN